MHIEYLIKMANDIAAFFVTEPPDVAAESVRQHMKRFWDKRMRAQIVAHYDETHGAQLEGAVLAAVEALAAESRT